MVRMHRLRVEEAAYTLILLGTLGLLFLLGFGGLSGMVVFTIGQHQPPEEILFRHALYGNATILVINTTTNETRIVYTQALPVERTFPLLGLKAIYEGNFTLILRRVNASSCSVYSLTPQNASGRLLCLGNASCCSQVNLTAQREIRINETVFLSRDLGEGNWTRPLRIEPAREDVLCKENCSQVIPRGWRLVFQGEVVPSRITYPVTPLEPFSVELVEQSGQLLTLRVHAVAPVRVENATVLSVTCNGSVVNVTASGVNESCEDAYLMLVEANSSYIRVRDALDREGVLTLRAEKPAGTTGKNLTRLQLQISRVEDRILENGSCEDAWRGRVHVKQAVIENCTRTAGFDTRVLVEGMLRIVKSHVTLPLGVLVEDNATFVCKDSALYTGPVSIVAGRNATLIMHACNLTGRVVHLS